MKLISLFTAALLGADAVRMRKSRESSATTKFIQGVPILNYHLAYDGASLSEAEKLERKSSKWILILKSRITKALMKKLCEKIKCTLEGNPDQGGVPFFEVETCEGGLSSFLGARLASKVVKYIEPSVMAEIIPEIEEEDQTQAASWGLDKVGAPKRPNDGTGTHIYVLDTGVRPTHEDFGGRVIPTLDMSSGSPVVCVEGQAAKCTNDVQGHGTHCAGTTAGEKYGVAPGATVHAVKVLSDRGSGEFSWSFMALDFLATKGERPAVASMSLGGRGVLNAMGDAVTAAVDAGVTVVVAGGNSNADACGFSPAFAEAAITVGSTTRFDSRSSFSNYGKCTEIWAPGSSIVSASHRSDTGSKTLSGTSMACPHVSGGAALVLERNPSLLSYEVLEELLSVAVDGKVKGLKTGDTNRLLYVGADASPAPDLPPTPAPAPQRGECASGCGRFKSFKCALYSSCQGCDWCGGGSLVEDAAMSGKGRKKSKGKGGKKAGAKADC